jgi:hypothetical protein
MAAAVSGLLVLLHSIYLSLAIVRRLPDLQMQDDLVAYCIESGESGGVESSSVRRSSP